MGELLIVGLLLKPRRVLHPSGKMTLSDGSLAKTGELFSRLVPIESVDAMSPDFSHTHHTALALAHTCKSDTLYAQN